jgi:hypothetical protein
LYKKQESETQKSFDLEKFREKLLKVSTWNEESVEAIEDATKPNNIIWSKSNKTFKEYKESLLKSTVWNDNEIQLIEAAIENGNKWQVAEW